MILNEEVIISSAILCLTNISLETMIFCQKEMLGILDLKSIGHLSNCYTFECADVLCHEFNNFVNALKKRNVTVK